MKIYAYVTTETCQVHNMALPGETIGRDDRKVSAHGDYTAWNKGKRETLALMADAKATPYQRASAYRVAKLLRWSEAAR